MIITAHGVPSLVVIDTRGTIVDHEVSSKIVKRNLGSCAAIAIHLFNISNSSFQLNNLYSIYLHADRHFVVVVVVDAALSVSLLL
jgi:predicted regulator of Ras-like GTPase activity (Roadblock/LC7/MglB family)